MRLIVCGGRDWANVPETRRALDAQHNDRRPITLVISGGARGADKLGEGWAEGSGVPCAVFQAYWDRFGKRAGMLRNGWMLEFGEPDGVIAFPGGSGTAGMIRLAERAGIPVWQPMRSDPVPEEFQ